MRVVSMLPAATEIVAALGASEDLVGVSHDCDHPTAVRDVPRVTHCTIPAGELASGDVDRRVREALQARGTIYEIDVELLRRLAPDVVLSQRLCDVCAPAHGSVARLAADLPGAPPVLNLEPSRIADVLGNVRTVAGALGRPEAGEALVASLERRIAVVRARTRDLPRRSCLLLEWLDPLYRSGHWGPELVGLAGGTEPLGRAGAHSTRARWGEVVAAAPEVMVLAGCGQSVARTLEEIDLLRARPGWFGLPAVRAGEVYVVDGQSYFSRPGPRLVDALELLAGALHPDAFPAWRPEAWPAQAITRWREPAALTGPRA